MDISIPHILFLNKGNNLISVAIKYRRKYESRGHTRPFSRVLVSFVSLLVSWDTVGVRRGGVAGPCGSAVTQPPPCDSDFWKAEREMCKANHAAATRYAAWDHSGDVHDERPVRILQPSAAACANTPAPKAFLQLEITTEQLEQFGLLTVSTVSSYANAVIWL